MPQKAVKIWAMMLICLAAAAPALAADVFKYSAESIQVFADESVTPELIRDGAFAEGEVTYSLNKTIATVDENGTVTGVSPGELWLTAQLTQGEKAVRTAKIRVVVCRNVP